MANLTDPPPMRSKQGQAAPELLKMYALSAIGNNRGIVLDKVTYLGGQAILTLAVVDPEKFEHLEVGLWITGDSHEFSDRGFCIDQRQTTIDPVFRAMVKEYGLRIGNSNHIFSDSVAPLAILMAQCCKIKYVS